MEAERAKRIKELQKEKDVVILAHYYVDGAVQEIADYVGDSFYLSKVATKVPQKTILFAGVTFMGESAKILNPDKTVVMADECADCPMAHMITADRIAEVREEYEDLAVVCYVNSTAEIKAVSDVCVTSSNAVKVVSNIPQKNIFFVPDNNLGRYVAEKLPEKHFIFHDGFCHVHKSIHAAELQAAKDACPDITDFEPGPDGESPLARHKDWVKTTCPCCGGPATRETDTMPQWAGSSWYFLRYMDPHCKDAIASKEALEYWSPVDWYNGGMEHTTLHLLYSRFWHKFLYDIGAVPSPEPYQKRTAHGMILGLNPHSFVNLPAEEQEKLLKEYGSQKAAEKALEEKYGEMSRHPIVKMSKSLGNVINPDEVVDQYGADTMRLYEMFMGDFEQAAPWQTSAIAGCNRFLDRVWTLSDKLVEGEGYRPQVETLMHQTIKKVGADIETLKMNTAIAQLMTLVNALYDNGGATKAELETVVQLLNPFAPHMTEELWEKLGHSHDEQLAYYPWPKYEEAKCVESTVEIAVQVNGKVKARLKVAADIDAAAAIAAAKADPAVAAALEGKQLVKEIYVKGRLVNLAVKG